jgi:excisionase family DNA binding protein
MSEINQEELLTVQEVACRLRVHDVTILRWIKGGALEAIMLPSRNKRPTYRIRKATLDGILKEA